MIHAKLKRLHSPEIFDLSSHSPAEPDNFGFLLQAMIRPANDRGEESFDLVVCTPDWLKQKCANNIVSGYHYLIVSRYNHAALQKYIEDFVSRCSGTSWREVARKLARLGRWEFEDYYESSEYEGDRLMGDA